MPASNACGRAPIAAPSNLSKPAVPYTYRLGGSCAPNMLARMPVKNTFRLFSVVVLTAVMAQPSAGQGRDTVFAVHKLFREKRRSGASYSAAADTAFSRQRYARRPNGQPTAQEAKQDALAATAFTMVGWAKAGRYSPERESYIIEAYQLGNPIPADIRGKLRRKHFHRTAQDVNEKR